MIGNVAPYIHVSLSDMVLKPKGAADGPGHNGSSCAINLGCNRLGQCESYGGRFFDARVQSLSMASTLASWAGSCWATLTISKQSATNAKKNKRRWVCVCTCSGYGVNDKDGNALGICTWTQPCEWIPLRFSGTCGRVTRHRCVLSQDRAPKQSLHMPCAGALPELEQAAHGHCHLRVLVLPRLLPGPGSVH